MRAESATGIRERLYFTYVHYLAGLSLTPPRRGASTALADKVAIILEQLLRRTDLFGTDHAGVEDGRLWVRKNDLLAAFEVPANIKRRQTYEGMVSARPDEDAFGIVPAVLDAFYPDPQKLYFLANARLTKHQEYFGWMGGVFPANRLVNERWRHLAQQRASITIRDVPFLGVPLTSSVDGRIWFVTRDERAVIESLRRFVEGNQTVAMGDIDRWVFGSRVKRTTRGGRRPATTREIEVVWPTDGAVLCPDEPHTFRARVSGAELSSYRMWYSGEGGLTVEMTNNDHAGCKECSQSQVTWKWRGAGPYALTFVAREPGWQEAGWALSKRVLIFLTHKGWYMPDEQHRKEILEQWRTETLKNSRFRSEMFPRS